MEFVAVILVPCWRVDAQQGGGSKIEDGVCSGRSLVWEGGREEGRRRLLRRGLERSAGFGTNDFRSCRSHDFLLGIAKDVSS